MVAGRLEFQDLLDLGWVSRLIKDYTDILKIPLFVIDKNGRFIIEPEAFCDYCKMIRNTERGRDGCQENFVELFETCSQFRGPDVISCHSRLDIFGMPILVEDEAIGVLGGCQVLPYRITDSEKRGYLRIAKRLRLPYPERLVSAVQRCRVFSDLEKKEAIKRLTSWGNLISGLALKELELRDVSSGIAAAAEIKQVIGQSSPVESIAEFILKRSMEILGVERGFVILRNEERTKLYPVAYNGLRKADVVILRNEIYKMAKGGERFIINDLEGGISGIKARAVLGIPLLVKGNLIGVMVLMDKASGRPFYEEDAKVVSSLVSEGSVYIENARLNQNMQDLFLDTIEALISTIEAKESHTKGHSKGVTRVSVAIGDVLGMKFSERAGLKTAALFHDIGKIGVIESVLSKSDMLTRDEFDKIKKHPIIGGKIISNIGLLKKILPGIVFHHERYDGTGYPKGLKGAEIPIISRIIAVSDAYDALISHRPYRKRIGKSEAIQEIRMNSGSQFDPRIVQAFLSACKDGAI